MFFDVTSQLGSGVSLAHSTDMSSQRGVFTSVKMPSQAATHLPKPVFYRMTRKRHSLVPTAALSFSIPLPLALRGAEKRPVLLPVTTSFCRTPVFSPTRAAVAQEIERVGW